MNKGDWAIVTGASSGMGKAFAERLAQRGLHVLAVALHGEDLEQCAAQWRQAHGIECVALALDLADPVSLQRIQQEIAGRNIAVSVLINAAGFGYFGDFCDMPAEQVGRMVQVNAIAGLQLCRMVLPQMQARKSGVIINVASIAGFFPYPFAAVYSGTKTLVHFFTKALWAENKEKGVRIFLLCPGYTQTNFNKVSTEPDSIHLFPPEKPEDIADKTLGKLSRRSCILYTKPSHSFKIFAARLLPAKLFARILRRLRTAKG